MQQSAIVFWPRTPTLVTSLWAPTLCPGGGAAGPSPESSPVRSPSPPSLPNSRPTVCQQVKGCTNSGEGRSDSPPTHSDIPAYGQLMEMFSVAYTVQNKTALVQEFEAKIGPSDAFMYSGNRTVR